MPLCNFLSADGQKLWLCRLISPWEKKKDIYSGFEKRPICGIISIKTWNLKVYIHIQSTDDKAKWKKKNIIDAHCIISI